MSGPASERPLWKRRDLLVLAALLVFGVTFVFAARYLGSLDRASFRLSPRPSLGPLREEVRARLGTWRPVLLEAGRTHPAGLAGPMARLQAAAEPGGALARLEETLQERVEASREDAALAGYLGWTRLLQGRPLEAVPPLRRAASGEPESADWSLLLALALLRAGRLEEGESVAAKGLREATGDPDLAAMVTRIRLEAGRPEEALKPAETTVREARRWPLAHRLMGRVAARLGDFGRAKRAWLDLLQLEPGDSEARRSLRRIGAEVP